MTTIGEVGVAALEFVGAIDARNEVRRRKSAATREFLAETERYPNQGDDPDVDSCRSELATATAKVAAARARLRRVARAFNRERKG